MSSPLSDRLRAAHADDWNRLIFHPFFEAVEEGALSDTARDAYFCYERRFVDQAVGIFAHLLIKAPGDEARRHLVTILSGLVTDQNQSFERIFDHLGLAADAHLKVTLPPGVTALCTGMIQISAERSYAAGLSAMLVAEWSYLTVSRRLSRKPPADRALRDWFDLHTAEGFCKQVAWLHEEIDRLNAPSLPFAEMSAAFAEAIALEIAFHSAPLEATHQ